jgi:hypothetical protein
MAKTKQSVLATRADIEKQMAEAPPEQKAALGEQLKSIDNYLEKLNPGARVLGYKPVTIEEAIYKHPFVAGPGEKRFVLDGVVLPHGTVRVEKATKGGVPGAYVTAWGFAGLGASSQETRFVPAGTLYSADKPELDRNPDLWRAQYLVAQMKGLNIDPKTRQLITPDVARQQLQEKLRLTMNAGMQDEAKKAEEKRATDIVDDFSKRNNLADLDSELVKIAAVCGWAGRLVYIDEDGLVSAMNVKPAPTDALLMATISASLIRQIKPIAPATAIIM